MFRLSAKKEIKESEIRGPTIFKKDKDVEYTIFAPFDRIEKSEDIGRSALIHFLIGVEDVLKRLKIGTSKLKEKRELIVEEIAINPTMFNSE